MAAVSLEERVALLEADIIELKRHLGQGEQVHVPWWDQIAGTFADDPIFEEAMRLGRQYREAQGSAELGVQDEHVSS